jgi:hypothetical protein
VRGERGKDEKEEGRETDEWVPLAKGRKEKEEGTDWWVAWFGRPAGPVGPAGSFRKGRGAEEKLEFFNYLNLGFGKLFEFESYSNSNINQINSK